jgi:hypothetical protein
VPRRTRRRGIEHRLALIAVFAVRSDPMQNLDALSEPLLVVRSGAIQVGG